MRWVTPAVTALQGSVARPLNLHFRLAPQVIVMWDLSNPTQILKLRMKHVRAGKMSQLICPDTHVLWLIGARGTPVPTGSTGPAPPLSLLPWFTAWRAICSSFFLPNFGLMTQIIKKLLLYFFESIAHPIIHACFPQHSILPSKYWLDRENGNNRRIYFHSNNWTKHFCLKISISEKKKNLLEDLLWQY